MNIRGVKALVLLYEACTDEQLKSHVLQLVPDLAECLPDHSRPILHRWLLSATNGSGEQLGSTIVISSHDDLDLHRENFAKQYDLATGVTVEVEKLAR